MATTFNLLDLIFIALTLIFVVTAFFRGFVKEMFALLNWVVSLVLSYVLAPYASNLLEHYSNNKLVNDISARSIIFVFVFFVFMFSTSSLCKSIQEKIPHSLDRSLGVFYGLIKTLLVFGFAYSLMLNLYGFLLGKNSDEALNKMPAWLSDAKCHNIIRISGEVMDPAVKLFFDAVTKNFDHVIPQKTLEDKINEVVDQKDLKNSKEVTPSSDSAIDVDSGYNKRDIEKMNRLIEIIDKK